MSRRRAVLVALAGVALSCMGPACAAPPNASGSPGSGRVALTFDDGPAPEWTPRILDLLAEEGVHATFFVVGANVERHPALARRIVQEGHVIANHTLNHLYTLTIQPGTTLQRELREGAAAIQAATGVAPRLMRWPVGILPGNVARADAAVRAAGAVHVGHSGRIFDAGGLATAAQITARTLRLAHDGAILALHDGHSTYTHTDQSATVAALAPILAGLRRRGLRPVTVAQLLGEAPYHAPTRSTSQSSEK